MCSSCRQVLAPMPGQRSTRQASIRVHLKKCFPKKVITPAENARRVLRSGRAALPRDALVPPKLLGAAFEVHRVIGDFHDTSPQDLRAVGSQAEGMHITSSCGNVPVLAVLIMLGAIIMLGVRSRVIPPHGRRCSAGMQSGG